MEQLTREHLYDLVWSEPISRIALRYAISDVGLAKICRRLDVPHPPRGYWAKLAVGKPAARPPLPISTINGPRYARLRTHQPDAVPPAPIVPEEERYPELGPTPSFPDDLADLRADVRKKVGRVGVPLLLHRTHPLAARLIQQDEQRRALLARQPWNVPAFDSRMAKRRLRILNALFLAFERMGATAEVKDDHAREVAVKVGVVRVPILLGSAYEFRRGGRSVAVKPTQLELRLASVQQPANDRGRWHEKVITLDSQLPDIVTEVFVVAEQMRRELAVRTYRDAVQLREDLQREERKRQEEAERRRVLKLTEAAVAHQQAEHVRSFVEAARLANHLRENPETLEEIEEWAAWAMDAADRIDPITSADPSIRLRITNSNPESHWRSAAG